MARGQKVGFLVRGERETTHDGPSVQRSKAVSDGPEKAMVAEKEADRRKGDRCPG